MILIARGALTELAGFIECLFGIGQGLITQLRAVPLRQPDGQYGQDVTRVGVDGSIPWAQFEHRQAGATAFQADQPEHEQHLNQAPDHGAAGAGQQVGEYDNHRRPVDMRRMQAAQLIDQQHRVTGHAGQRHIGWHSQRQHGTAQYQQHQWHAEHQQQRAIHQCIVAQAAPLDTAVQANDHAAQGTEGEGTGQQDAGLVGQIMWQELPKETLSHENSSQLVVQQYRRKWPLA